MDAAECVACGTGGLRTVETIAAAQIIDAWRREDLANGQVEIAGRRAALLQSTLPQTIRFEQCPACGLQMAHPRLPWAADDYPEDQSYPVRWEFHRCLEDLGNRPLDILEIGCGTGQFLALATGRGHRSVGVDFAASAVAAARARGVDAVHGPIDALTTHVPSSTRFDAVVAFQVFEHLSDPGELLQAIERWVRPDARLCLASPGPRRYTRLIREQQAGRSDFWDYPPHHVLRWTLPAFEALVRRHGWTPALAVEEPLQWVGAASHIGIARALHRGTLRDPLRRRATIAGAWLTLATASRAHRSGISVYVCARRTGSRRGFSA